MIDMGDKPVPEPGEPNSGFDVEEVLEQLTTQEKIDLLAGM